MTAPRNSSGPKPALVVGAVVLVVLVAAVLAVLLTGTDSDTDVTPGTTVAVAPVEPGALDPRLPAELVGQVRPLEVEGEALVPLPESGADPAIGSVPPTLFGEDATGFVHTISPGIDGPIMLVFLAHWCPACQQELPMLVQLERDGRMPEDLTVFAVLTAMDPQRPEFPPSAWISGAEWPFAWVADEPDLDLNTWKAAEAYGLTGFPFITVIDEGVVADRWSGASTAESLLARLDAALS
jgi:cytochrome c biogenesis protein CcmG/thiol:disulfide interchange protein DsbE